MPLAATFLRLAIVVAVAATLGQSALAKDWTTIRIGAEGGHPPFNFLNDMNQLQGFEIDIARAICERAQVSCEFVQQDFAGLIPALLAGRYDAVFSSLSITEQRRAFVDFTDRYYKTPSMFVANRRKAGFSIDPDAMREMTIGTKEGTTNANFLDAVYAPRGVRIRHYTTLDEARLDLADGKIDALLGDKTAQLHWLEGPIGDECCQIVGADVYDVKFMGDGIGAAVRKGDQDLKALINRHLAEIRTSGQYDMIRRRYFAFDPY